MDTATPKHRRRVAFAAVLAAAVIASSSPAQATDSSYDGDTRHCVTPREVWIIGRPLTKDQVETRWESAGLGTLIYLPGAGQVWAYPMCDGSPDLAFHDAVNGRLAYTYGIVHR